MEMNMSEEIHTIKNSIISLQNMINGLVHKLGNLSVLENQQANDKENVSKLSEEVDKLIDVIAGLSTNVATMNGIASGKRTMWLVFGSLITLSIVAICTTVILHNSTLDVHSVEIKDLKAKIKELEAKE